MRRLTLLLLTLPMPMSGQGVPYNKEHYTKHEFQIPMRDGVKLYTAVYTPKDTSENYPILVNRTP